MPETETVTTPPPATLDQPSQSGADGRPDKFASLRRDRRRYHRLVLMASIVVLMLALALEVNDGSDVVIPGLNVALPQTCMMRRLSGVNCPGCGLTRSFISIGRGDIAGAWHYNAAGWLIFAVVLVQPPFRSFQLWRLSKGIEEWNPPWLSSVAWILLAALAAQWLWRLVA